MQGQHRLVAELGRHGALDDGAVRHAAGGGHALRDLLGLPLCGEAGDDDRPLAHGVDLAVRRLQRRHDERAALERGRIAHGGDGDVDAGARLHEGRHVGGDDDGGDVLGARAAAFRGDAEIFQHGADGLLGEGRVAQRIARALQADDQAVADELVVAGALQLRQVLDARGHLSGRQRARPAGHLEHAAGGGRVVGRLVEHAAVLGGDRLAGLCRQAVGEAGLRAERGGEREGKRPHLHEAPTRTVPSVITVPVMTLPLSTLRTLTRSPAEPGCRLTPAAEMVSGPATK